MEGKVSVVIPAHNAGLYLAGTIRSALHQSLAPAEIIVVDDRSTDTTAEIARSFGDTVRVIANDGPRGASSARNTGVKAAAGDLIAFLDADDVALQGRFEAQAASLASTGAAAVFCDVSYIDSAGAPLGGEVTFPEFDAANFFGQLVERNRIATTSAVTARRECLLKAGGFDEELAFNEEYDLWLRLARSNRFGHIAETLLLYRLHPGNISRDREGQARNEARALAKYDSQTLLEALSGLHGNTDLGTLALSLVFLRLGRLEESARLLEGMKARLDREALYHFARGNIALLSGRPLEAADFMTTALALDPALSPAHNNLGVALVRLDKPGRALLEFKKALAQRPGYGDAEFNHAALKGLETSSLKVTLVPLRKVLKPEIGDHNTEDT